MCCNNYIIGLHGVLLCNSDKHWNYTQNKPIDYWQLQVYIKLMHYKLSNVYVPAINWTKCQVAYFWKGIIFGQSVGEVQMLITITQLEAMQIIIMWSCQIALCIMGFVPSYDNPNPWNEVKTKWHKIHVQQKSQIHIHFVHSHVLCTAKMWYWLFCRLSLHFFSSLWLMRMTSPWI